MRIDLRTQVSGTPSAVQVECSALSVELLGLTEGTLMFLATQHQESDAAPSHSDDEDGREAFEHGRIGGALDLDRAVCRRHADVVFCVDLSAIWKDDEFSKYPTTCNNFKRTRGEPLLRSEHETRS